MTSDAKTFSIDGHAHPADPIEAGLHVVSTPIGHLGDVTLRALRTLAAADIVAAEDTRHTRRLLDRYAIPARAIAYHQHNEAQMSERLAGEIAAGRSVALVSDAGTPLVSDPGQRLVALCRERGLRIVPVPGASAPLAALVASGLGTDAFTFAGFPPPKSAARRAWLERYRTAPGTLVLFEAPHRLADSLADMADVLSERRAVVARELTKRHEEAPGGTLGELAARYASEAVRGEIVVCIAPGEEVAADPAAVLADLLATMPVSRAAGEAAKLTGRPKREMYAMALAMRDGEGAEADEEPERATGPARGL